MELFLMIWLVVACNDGSLIPDEPPPRELLTITLQLKADKKKIVHLKRRK